MRAAVSLVLLVGLVFSAMLAEDPRDDYRPDPAYVVASVQVLATSVGFGGTFSLGADGRTLVATGLDLCGEDFLDELPETWHRDVLAAGLERFVCTGGNVAADVNIVRVWRD